VKGEDSSFIVKGVRQMQKKVAEIKNEKFSI